MDVYIASNDAVATSKLRTCLRNLGIECPTSRIVSTESAAQLRAKASPARSPIVFFVSQLFSTNEFDQLKQLCAEDRGTKVIAVGSRLSAAIILHAIRCGACDCIDADTSLELELKEVLGRIAATPQPGHRSGRLFTVVGVAGGAGASLLAVNLAAAFALRSQSAGLLDLHLRSGDIAALMKCEPRHTLSSLAAKCDQLDLAMFDQSLVKHACGIEVLASPEPFSDYRAIRPELILKVVQLARTKFENVIVDLEDCEHEEQARVLATSQRIIVVLRPDFVAVRRAKKLLEFFVRCKVAPDHVTLVANRLGTTKSLDRTLIEDALGQKVDYGFHEEPDAINESGNLGIPLVIQRPDTKISEAITSFADHLLGITPTKSRESWLLRLRKRLKMANPQTSTHLPAAKLATVR